jgi:hypothetical protein
MPKRTDDTDLLNLVSSSMVIIRLRRRNEQMRPKLTVLLMVLGLALTTSLRSQEKQNEPPRGAPKLVVELTTHDFGLVRPGTPLKYSFKIKNEGTADLLIQSVSPG